MSSIFIFFPCCNAQNHTLPQHKAQSEDGGNKISGDATDTLSLATSDDSSLTKAGKEENLSPNVTTVTASTSQDSHDQTAVTTSPVVTVQTVLDPTPPPLNEVSPADPVVSSGENIDENIKSSVQVDQDSEKALSISLPESTSSPQTRPLSSSSFTPSGPGTGPVNLSAASRELNADDFDLAKESSTEKVITMDELASSSFFISKKLFQPKTMASPSESLYQLERCDTAISEVSANLNFGEISRQNSNTSDIDDITSRNTSMFIGSGSGSHGGSMYQQPISASSSFTNGMRRESFPGIVIPNLVIPGGNGPNSGGKGTSTSRLGTPVSRPGGKSSPANAIERVRRSSAAGDELKRSDSPSSVLSGTKTPTADQVMEAYGRRMDLLRYCIEKELEACQALFHTAEELDQIPMFRPLVKWLCDHYLSVSPVILYRMCVKIAWKTIEYFFLDYKNHNLKLLKSRLFDITEAVTDTMSALFPSLHNIQEYLRSAIATSQEEEEFGNIAMLKEYQIATGKLMVSIVIDIARVISRQLPQSMRFHDLDFKVTRVLREADFEIDDVYVLPVKMSFSSIAKRSKQSPSHRMVTFATEGDDDA